MEFERNRRYHTILAGLAAALAGFCLIALSVGRDSMNPADVIRVLVERITDTTPSDYAMHNVVFIIRIPV